MSRTGDSARLVLKPDGAGVRPLRAIDADHPGGTPPFVTWPVSTLLSAEHNHVPDPIRTMNRLGSSIHGILHFVRAVQMYNILRTLVPHLGTFAKRGCIVHLAGYAAKLSELLFLQKSSWNPECLS